MNVQEKSKMIEALAAEPGGDGTKRCLQENLVEQLQVHLDNLKAARSAKLAALGGNGATNGTVGMPA